MVVIDAEKHKLDYKKSEQDNGITALKKKYQAHEDDDGYGGASTLISRAKSETSVLKRKGSPIIDKETGEQSWKSVREEYVDKNGKIQVRTQKKHQDGRNQRRPYFIFRNPSGGSICGLCKHHEIPG